VTYFESCLESGSEKTKDSRTWHKGRLCRLPSRSSGARVSEKRNNAYNVDRWSTDFIGASILEGEDVEGRSVR
jgi:hypothetical protein